MKGEDVMKKVVVFVIVLVLLASLQGTGLAAGQAGKPDTTVSPMLIYISDANCHLSISSGTASMSSTLTCVSSMDRLRMVEYLQKYDGGWVTIKSYSQNFYSTDHGNWLDTYTVTSGYQYRLYCSYYVYIGSSVVESTTRSDTASY